MDFDAEAFMNAVTNEANATHLPSTPEGEYTGQICDVKVSNGIVNKQGDYYGKPWYRLDFFVETSDPAALVNMPGRTSRKIRGGIMLDVTASGGIASGPDQNTALGRLRKAAGLNIPGQQFAPNMLNGRLVKFQVKNKINPTDPEQEQSEAVAFKAV